MKLIGDYAYDHHYVPARTWRLEDGRYFTLIHQRTYLIAIFGSRCQILVERHRCMAMADLADWQIDEQDADLDQIYDHPEGTILEMLL